MSDIQWPAFLQYAGTDELTYLHNADAWQTLVRNHLHCHPHDRLIDANGQVFAIKADVLHSTHEQAVLADILSAIRAHAAHHGQCCVAKFSAGSIPEAMNVLAGLDEG